MKKSLTKSIMINHLPSHLTKEIFFKMDPKSLANMECTGKSIHSFISNPNFKSEYVSRVGSSVLHISSEGSNSLSCLSFFESGSPKTLEPLELKFQILGSCSGLLLVFINGLCVANPFTKKFRFLNHFRSNLFPRVSRHKVVQSDETVYIGFAVDQIDKTTQRFKIVCINDRMIPNQDETMYQFEINAGDSSKLSKTTITCRSNEIDKRMKPVYSCGSLHWLRKDGSIIAFNPDTEQAQLIPIKFPEDFSSKMLFATDNNELTLISATNEVIYVYTIVNILTEPKWVIARRIKNVVVDEQRQLFWKVVSYDGKFLMLWETRNDNFNGVVHGYNLRSNTWGVMGSIPVWYSRTRDFYQFTPSIFSVIGLDEDEENVKLFYDSRISSLSLITRLIVGVLPDKIEMQLRNI